MLYGNWLIILISPYLFPLSLWIQITIHPLSTDGAIVILVFAYVNITCQTRIMRLRPHVHGMQKDLKETRENFSNINYSTL